MARSSTNNAGRRATGRRGGDRQINSGNRPTMGAGIYKQPVDAPSGHEFRAGMVTPRHSGKSDAPDSRGGHRRSGGLAQTTLGARYRITPNVNAVVMEDPRTLRATRVVPSTSGTGRNFWAQGRSYGAAL
jgi:hypothetical protein